MVRVLTSPTGRPPGWPPGTPVDRPPKARITGVPCEQSDELLAMLTQTRAELAALSGAQMRLLEAEETLRAIRHGEVDALVVSNGAPGEQVFTLSSADRPYRIFVENMREGAATLSASGVVLFANKRLGGLLGCPASTLVARRDHRFRCGGPQARLSRGHRVSA